MSDSNYISIGIPFYNAEFTLLDSVRSVFAQTYQDWELILIDDGSTDRSLEIAQSIDDPRVTVYSDGKNRRLGARLNQIVDIAKYDFIARMDSDDLMAPNRIQKLFDILKKNEEYDLVSCGAYSITDDNSLRGYRGQTERNYTFDGLFSKSQKFLHAGLVARKVWFQRHRYDESLKVGEDNDLWLRAAKVDDFNAMSIEDPLYMYKEEGNVTMDKLLTAYQIERSHYVKLIDSKRAKLKYIVKSYGKTYIVRAMEATNTLPYLLNSRNKNDISKRDIDIFNKQLEQIFSTNVPGVDND